MKDACAFCLSAGYDLIVVDTFASWAALGKDAEKDAGAILSALQPLLDAASKGLAVVLVHHVKKGTDEVVAGVRGSSALAGAVDIILALDSLGSSSPVTHRVLKAQGRFSATPPSLVVELTDDGYVSHDDSETARAEADRERIYELLVALGGSATSGQIAKNIGINEVTVRRHCNTLHGALKRIDRLGEGKAGNPFRWVAKSMSATAYGGVADSIPWEETA